MQAKILCANMIYEKALNIYVDGSSYSNPRRGGIGIRYVTVDDAGNEVFNEEALPGYKDATNNQTELMACIKALEGACSHKQIGSVEKVFVFTDSKYVTDNLSRAIYQWSKQRWMNSSGRPIENAELWKNLIRLMRKVPRKVEFKWVKGHSTNVHNRAADKLAKQSAKGVLNKPLRVTTIRRKITAMSVEVGSVGMRGQEFSVRIITDTYLNRQKLYKYKYEVMSNDSEYFGKVDWIYSEHLLRAGHHYAVKVNHEGKNPRIMDVLGELSKT